VAFAQPRTKIRIGIKSSANLTKLANSIAGDRKGPINGALSKLGCANRLPAPT